MNKIEKILFILTIPLLSQFAYSLHLQEVRISGLFPFETSDDSTVNNATYTTSERLQIISGLPMALTLYQNQAEKCGYYFSYKFNGFNMRNRISLKNIVDQINLNNSWIVYGPEMNTSYFLAHQLLNSRIPHITSFTLLKDQDNSITMSPSVDTEISALIKVVEDKNLGRNYLMITDNTCDMCQIYKNSARKIFQNKGFTLKSEIIFNKNDFNEIKSKILSINPDFILLNLDGTDSGLFIAKTELNQFIFIGAKIWGTDVSSDLTLNYNLKKANGFTVRPLPPVNYDSIKLQIVDNDKISRRLMDNPYYMKYFVSKLTESLCKYKPKDMYEFEKLIKTKKIFSRDKFKFATYVLKEGVLKLENTFIIKENSY